MDDQLALDTPSDVVSVETDGIVTVVAPEAVVSTTMDVASPDLPLAGPCTDALFYLFAIRYCQEHGCPERVYEMCDLFREETRGMDHWEAKDRIWEICNHYVKKSRKKKRKMEELHDLAFGTAMEDNSAEQELEIKHV